MASKKKKINFSSYLVIFLLIVTLITCGLIYFINVLPLQYFLIFSGILLFFNLMVFILISSKGKIKNVVGIFVTIVMIIVQILLINYELSTLDFLKQFGFNNYKTETYKIIVRSDSDYKKISDLKSKYIGYLDRASREGLNNVIRKLERKIEFVEIIKEDINTLTDALFVNDVDAIILEETELEILQEEDANLIDKIKILDTIEIDIELENITKDVDITKEPFSIYISGIDTYGKVNKVSRSDVNIIVTVNPNTNKILLTSIPRDYYVTLAGINSKDKLTHAGIYGVETSVKTLENLLDIEINYYIKVNFSSLINIVDALDGISVNSNYKFTSVDGYYYNKGINYLDGKKALSFVRERKSFANGDRIRGENQELVLAALIEKAVSPSIIVSYNDLLKALSDSFIANIETNALTKLIKKQIENPSKWDIESIALDGTDAYEYTYSYKSQKLYVMIPADESVKKAKSKITHIKNITTG